MTIKNAIHSNAFHFLSFLLKGVDARTGQYTVSVDMPELKSNRLCGPAVPLQLQFNPLNLGDSGFGLGWNLNLSQYTPGDRMLALSTGETFKVTGSGPQPVIKEKKLDSFHFYDQGNDSYRVVHKSGLVEILHTGGSADNRVALPVQMLAPSGHSVSLTYLPFRGGQRLETVSDAYGTLLRIERDANDTFVRFHLHPGSGPGGGPLATFEMKLDGDGHVRAIVLPTEEQASWRFQYETLFDVLCLTEVQTPVGGRETIEYLDGGHRYPGVARDPLPRVTRHRVYPGFEQPMVEVTYSYTDHNFLGNGAPIGWDDDGLDNLYKAPAGYEYGSVETLMIGGLAARTVSRTFNRFHLVLEDITTQGDCVKRLDTQYHALEVPFDEQPAQFQLPTAVTTTWFLKVDPSRLRSVVERTAFDEHGNLVERVQTSGVRETLTWYSREGEEGCPADPQGFVRHQKDQTTWPAISEHGQASAVRVGYRYQTLPALSVSGAEAWLALSEETLTAGDDAHTTPVQITDKSYYNQPDDATVHGLLHSESQTLNRQMTKTEYAYSTLFSRQAGETVRQVVETLTGFDGNRKQMTRQHSLFNGEVLLDHDTDNDVQISYRYDVLERVVRETIAPGTEFEASRTYEYSLTSLQGQQAVQGATDVNGVATRTLVDGLNRVVVEERQNADGAEPEEFRQTYEATYDEFGHVIAHTEFDWLDTQTLALKRVYDFDDWGEQMCETGPDGVREFARTDPIGTPESMGPIVRRWHLGPGRDGPADGTSETWMNLFEKPSRVERLDKSGRRLSLHRYLYDGLGRTAEEYDGRDAWTQYRYDVFDRRTETVLPDTAVVKRWYAGHSTDDLPTGISVNGIELGTQRFDGLDRRIESVVGGRLQTFAYDAGQLQPGSVTTPAGQQIGYDYQPQLHDQPLHRYLPQSLTAQYDYDRTNARLSSCHEADQTLTRSYFSTGDLKTETRLQAGGEPMTMHYSYSRTGRLLTYTDVFGQTQHYRYDRAGRLEATDLDSLSTSFGYDALGRLRSIHTLEGGRSLEVTLEYDDLGREKLRTFVLDGVIQTLAQEYDAVDAVVRRTLMQGAQLLRDETYQYDLRGRLEVYGCEGSQPPVDPYGQIIRQQVFAFDELDNMMLVQTRSPEGVDLARFTYDERDPVQLRRITHSDSVNYPAQIDLDYDANGNLIHDERQRTLTYDALNRLLAVEESDGTESNRYSYDPVDRLASAGQDNEQRFYRGDDLASRMNGSQASTFVRGAGQLLGEKPSDVAQGAVLLACDTHQSVLAEAAVDHAHGAIAYSPYGWRDPDSQAVTGLAFNGELTEGTTGWQLLGNGYRAFNPVLMRFNSPDSLSPFDEGGVNGYAYCEGDPVNHADPSGHFIGALAGLLGIVGVGLIVWGTQVKDNKILQTSLYIGGGMLVAGALLTFGLASTGTAAREVGRKAAWELGRRGGGDRVRPQGLIYQHRPTPTPTPNRQPPSSGSLARLDAPRGQASGRAPQSTARPVGPVERRVRREATKIRQQTERIRHSPAPAEL
ncbi:RHS repeat-associated core domain-containing protein [Pseudomonas sp. R1-18]|uniref:RHS repeat domain-containing protein n=1 Tax=Pseudomonas sp. R1-18 TaxID=1632772 RepID=UPI003DA92A3C